MRVVFETVDNVRHAVFDEDDLKVDEQAEGACREGFEKADPIVA